MTRLTCDNLVRIYQSESVEVQALQGLDLLVHENEMVALVGASGSGKSTLLNVLAGVDSPTAGRARVAGSSSPPVLVAAVTGLAVGVGCAYAALGALSLGSLSAAPGPPTPAVPWWTVLSVALLAGCAVVLALLDWRRARGTPLAELLRT